MPVDVLPLSPVEARVLAVLVEKEAVTPDAYPLSLNALVAGCNQKSSRDPVMDLSDRDVLEALDRLRAKSLAIESSGGRVMRYSENARRVLAVPRESVALLATLVLRGPQTSAELRAHCERLHRFSDVSATEGFLHELAERPLGAYVRLLPRQPAARESRWAHLLCGEPALPDSAAPAGEAGGSMAGAAALDDLRERVERLEAEVAALREALARR